MKFQFPFVTRAKYERLEAVAKNLCNQVIELEDARDNIIGRAADLADIERNDRELERGHFEAVLTNINQRGK